MKKMPNNYKKEVIDLDQLAELVHKDYLPKINLVFNKDVPKEPKKPNDLILCHFQSYNESETQSAFCKMVEQLNYELQTVNKLNRAFAVQIDNGDSAGGNLSQIQRMNLYKRKKAEGSKAGFPDLMIPYSIRGVNLHNTIFCEVKRITTPSNVKISKEQLKWFIELNDMGYNAYITNNPIFFKNVILQEIRDWLK